MSYSRRQLEAFGETLGECVTRKEGGRIIYGGGGGGGGSGTQTQVSDLPEWARPYAQETLEKGKALTGREYVPYRGERIAGFQRLQNQAFGAAGSLTPSQAGEGGIGAAGAATMRALGTRYNPFQTGQFTGGAASEYMSPYMQAVVDAQQREAIRQSGIQGAQNQAQATMAGAFGGSRAGLLEAERQRNLGTQLGQIQAQGLQTAFQNAQQQFNTEQQLREQSRQYGAGLGLQGLQTALQGAGQLGQLGAQQFGQQKDIIGLQSQLGAQQQQLEQQRLSQQYQDFQNQQKYPYQQLEFMSNLIRGTPMGTVQTLYGAQPTMAQQVGSLGLGAYGLSQLARAEGGSVSSYADGGSVEDPQNIEEIVGKLSDAQLKQAAQAAQARGDVQQLQIIQQEQAMRASERGGIAGAFNTLPYSQQEQMMAGGGIVAFAGDEDNNEDGGLGQLVGGMMPSEGNPEVYKQLTGYFPALLRQVAGAKYTPMSDEKYNEAIAARRKMLEEGAGPSSYESIKQQLADLRGEGEKELAQGKGIAALQAAAALSQGRGLAQGLGRAGGAFAESYGQALRADSAQKRALTSMEINLADAQRKERMGLNRDAISAADQARRDHDAAQQFGIKKAQALAGVAGRFAQATKPTKGAGGGPKPMKLAEQLADAEIAHENNPTEASLAKVTALRRAMDRARTSDIGPTRAGVAESQAAIKLGDAITKEQSKVRISPEYLEAKTQKEKDALLKAAADRVRANAAKNPEAVNANPSPQGSTRLQFDAQGNQLPG